MVAGKAKKAALSGALAAAFSKPRKRGKYDNFVEDFSSSDGEYETQKRRLSDDSDGSSTAGGVSVAHSLFGNVHVTDKASFLEKERALRNLDLLFAIAQEREEPIGPQPPKMVDQGVEVSEVCGFRIRK